MANKVVEEKFAAIVEAVSYWLGYQYKIGREQLIHEASLRYPIADTITAKGTPMDKVVLEQLHPLFKSKKIDLVVYDKDIREGELNVDNKANEVYEFKLSKHETGKQFGDEHQRVFDDVVRLGYFHLWDSRDCYFLMCGKYDDFKAYFVGQRSSIVVSGGKNVVQSTPKSIGQPKWEPEGLYKEWFGFKMNEVKRVTFNTSTANNGWGLKAFQDSYTPRPETGKGFTGSINIKTTCMAITSPGLEHSRTHAAGIWKIESETVKTV